MRSWKLWDWLAYTALFISAVVLAADAGLKNSSFKVSFDWLLASSLWNFAPLFLIVCGSLSLLIRDGQILPRWNGGGEGNKNQNVLSDGIVASGSDDSPPEFRGRFRRPGRSVLFYLEYEYLPVGVLGGAGWSGQRKFQIFELTRFAVNQQVRFPLMSFDRSSDGVNIWSFGYGQFKNDEPILHRALYRGRVIVTEEDFSEQNFYFIMRCDGDGVPEVTGQHIFDHLVKWEGQSREGDPESLFT